MADTTRSLSILGGPRSGKSSYFGALHNAVETDACTLVQSSRLRPDDTRALARLTRDIVGGSYPQRTNPDEQHTNHFALDLPTPIDGVGHFTMAVEDYNGEELEALFRYRTSGWSDAWKRRASAQGLLVFLRPDKLVRLPQRDMPDVSEERRWRFLIDGPEEPSPDEASSTALPATPSELFPEAALVADEHRAPRAAPDASVREPTELTVIELLQFLREVRGLAHGERPLRADRFRLAVVLSAWDAVDRAWQEKGPRRYVIEQLPLLHDFLWSNFHLDRDVEFFGVSSTGGDLNDPRFKKAFRDAETPPGHVDWNDGSLPPRRTRDLSVPLLWALFGESVLPLVAWDAP